MRGEQIGIRCVFMRGGTSKGCFILDKDLPKDPELRNKVILRIYGSPDSRQIDGMGGSDPLTSKIAIIKQSERSDADVEYTFGQVGVNDAQVTYGGNCGNMLSAVGPFAIDNGLVAVKEPETTVRIFNTNTKQIIHSDIQVKDGQSRVLGDCSVSGVPGTGSLIRLNFMGAKGSMTGKLLPTGNPVDKVKLDIGEVEVSLIDSATAFVFVDAKGIGMRGDELAEEILNSSKILERLELIRSWAAVQVGAIKEGENATAITPNVPRVAAVCTPHDYKASTGNVIKENQIHLIGRQMSMQKPHKTYAVTGGICTAVAAQVPGSIVNKLSKTEEGSETLKIGHPAGIIEVQAEVKQNGDDYDVGRAALVRTARKLMEGHIYIPIDSWDS